MVKINDLIKKLQEVKDIRGNVQVEISSIGEFIDNRVVVFEGLRGNLVAIGETAVGKAKKFPTAKQTYSLNLIMKYVPEARFTGRTKEEARIFINDHKHKVPVGAKVDFSEYKVSFPTPKQIGYINSLEEQCGVAFTGSTFKEATEYINTYGNTNKNKSNNTVTQDKPLKSLEPVGFEMIDEDEIPF